MIQHLYTTLIDNVKWMMMSIGISVYGFITPQSLDYVYKTVTVVIGAAVGIMTLYKMRREFMRKREIDILEHQKLTQEVEINKKKLEGLSGEKE